MYTKTIVRIGLLMAVCTLAFLLFPTIESHAADPVGTINTFVGTGTSGNAGDGGPATLAQLGTPSGVAADAFGNIYIVDLDNHALRKVDHLTGIITRVVGSATGHKGFSGDGGPATAALLDAPNDVTVDANGNLYISDQRNHRVRKVDVNGIITTVAGSGSGSHSGDGGPALSAGLPLPHGLDVDAAGNLYITTPYDARVRKVDVNGVITTFAGTGSSNYSGDGGPATAAGLGPVDVDADANGNIYIADITNNRIRKVDGNGIITTIAGTGQEGSSGDGGPAINAQLNRPEGVTVDSNGTVYIGDRKNYRVRKVDTNGIITAVAGTGNPGYTGDGGPAVQAEMRDVMHLVVDPNGNLYITDYKNHRIRSVVLGICTNVTQIPQPECEALVDIFEATNGSAWTNNSNWLQTTTPCSWFGVTCANGRVLRLDLPNNQLSGALPQSAGAFSTMHYFDVSRNSIGGNIPAELGDLSSLLYLHLAYNQFTGGIPADLGNLNTVVFFYLHSNQLAGAVPPELSGLSMVKALILTNNNLSGAIPASLGSLPELQRLHLTNNSFSGAVPLEIGSAAKLKELYLNGNQLVGALPLTLTNLASMTGLWFQNTNLCEPTDSTFQSWLAAISNVQSTGVLCGSP